MKKILSIVLAAILVLSMSVIAFADETLFEHEILFPEDNGWWQDYADLRSNADLIAAVKTEGAKLVIKADAIVADGADGHGYQYGFQDTNSWVDVLVHFNFAGGEGNLAAESVVIDGDYAIITVDCKAIMDAAAAAGAELNAFNWINGACAGAKTYSISVIIPDASAEAPAENTEAPAENTEAPAENTEAPAETTAPAETSEPANTGIVLAVLPMAVAAAAVVASKRK